MLLDFDSRLAQARVQRIAQAIAEQVEGEHGEHDGDAWEKDEVRRVEEVFVLCPSTVTMRVKRVTRAVSGEAYKLRELCGSSASLKPSPIKLVNRIVITMNRLGKSHIHHTPRWMSEMD